METIQELLKSNNEILVVTNSRLTSINEEITQQLKEQKQINTSLINHIKGHYDELENKDSERCEREEIVYQFLASLLLDFWDYR
jgi:cell division GTPase FtsZ